MANDEEDAENNRPGPSNSKNRSLSNNHASNTTLDKDKNQDDRFYPSEMGELRQPYTPVGTANETLDETIIINENRQGNADHHSSVLIAFNSILMLSIADHLLRFKQVSSLTTNSKLSALETIMRNKA